MSNATTNGSTAVGPHLAARFSASEILDGYRCKRSPHGM
jgi:hypothetical protein